MAEPLYVPVLPVRRHARTAYEHLAPDVQAAVVPLWNLPPCPGMPAADYVGPLHQAELTAVRGAHRRHPGWVDAPFADDAQTTAVERFLAAYDESSLLRPVTGPGRGRAQQEAAWDAAHVRGSGLGLRVVLPGEWDGVVPERVGRLLARGDPSVPVDLLLDLGSVGAVRREAGKEALRALDELVPLRERWRTVAVLCGAFPPVTGDLVEVGRVREEPRGDWETWDEVRAGRRTYLPRLRYGDYCVQPTTALAQAPSRNGPPWGLLRYTTERSFVLCKVLTGGRHRTAIARAAAARIVELPEFRGENASAGEAWLRACAGGPLTSSKGTGQHEQWLRAGSLQHMTFVVRCLRGPG
ncbi:beta family protein [Streptomyces sparsus]